MGKLHITQREMERQTLGVCGDIIKKNKWVGIIKKLNLPKLSHLQNRIMRITLLGIRTGDGLTVS